MTSNFQIVVVNALFEECTRNFLTNSHIISRSLVPVTLSYGFNIFRELRSLGISKSHILGSVIIGNRGMHKHYVINSYGHKVGSYIT
jgi:hypothetical protein